jgi:hypothetical protein
VVGLLLFKTQGVLKNNLAGWIVPTIIAFGPFLVLLWLVGKALAGRMRDSRAFAVYYLAAGGVGLAFEWTLMGLGPWKNPNVLQVPFQLGMFSFWVAAACTPRLLLDGREAVAAVRRRFCCALFGCLALVYAATLSSPPQARFAVGIVAVLVAFLLLNVFYFQYFRALAGGEGEDG